MICKLSLMAATIGAALVWPASAQEETPKPQKEMKRVVAVTLSGFG